MNIDASRNLLASFDEGRFDVIVFRSDHDHCSGDFLFEEKMSWLAASSFEYAPHQPLKLATLSSACGVRDLVVEALDGAGLDWNESFVGGGVSAVSAAVNAGLAITVLAHRLMPIGSIDVGGKFNLPKLPNSQVAIKRRRRDIQINASIDLFLRAFQNFAIR